MWLLRFWCGCARLLVTDLTIKLECCISGVWKEWSRKYLLHGSIARVGSKRALSYTWLAEEKFLENILYNVGNGVCRVFSTLLSSLSITSVMLLPKLILDSYWPAITRHKGTVRFWNSSGAKCSSVRINACVQCIFINEMRTLFCGEHQAVVSSGLISLARLSWSREC